MLIDTHIHLDDTRFDADRDQMIARSKEAGVAVLVSIGTALDDSRWLKDYLPGKKDIYGTVGIHPERTHEWQDADIVEYEALAQMPGVVGIGEVGLDYHSKGYDAPLQHRVFREMIRLSKRRKLPLVIHQREAADDTLRLLEEEGGGSEGGVFHCFAGDAACAAGAIKLGFCLAVGGIFTYPSAQNLRDVIKDVPLDRLVLETDGPWLAPQSQRGKRNEPAYMASVAAKLAEIKGTTVDEIERITTENAKRLFRITV